MRSISNATLSFGLVSIPLKIYMTASSKQIGFNWLSPKRNRVSQKLFDSLTGEEVNRADVISAYEVQKDQFISFDKEELAIVKKENSVGDHIEIFEAVKDIEISPFTVERAYYTTPNKSDRAYRLLYSCLALGKKSLVAKWYRSGKDNLVIISPLRNMLVMYQLYYEEEIIRYDANYSANSEPTKQEVKLGMELLNSISSPSFNLAQFKDEYQARLLAAIEEKKNGKMINSEKRIEDGEKLFDLINTLKRSLKKQKE